MQEQSRSKGGAESSKSRSMSRSRVGMFFIMHVFAPAVLPHFHFIVLLIREELLPSFLRMGYLKQLVHSTRPKNIDAMLK